MVPRLAASTTLLIAMQVAASAPAGPPVAIPRDTGSVCSAEHGAQSQADWAIERLAALKAAP